jgi:glucose-6-phosphate dehydrogenase assembly protein OpcA
LLLAGWLASRLGWEPAREGAEGRGKGQPFLFRAGGRSIRIECRPRRCQTEFAGTCVSVALKSGGGSPGEFSLARCSGVNTATTRMEIPGRPPIERVVRLEPLEEVRLVNEEIKFAGRDRVYEEALAMVAGMTAPGA